MTAFWQFAKHLLHEKTTLFWALVFAFLSASGLAVGLISMGPILALVIDPSQGRSLPELAREFNIEDRWFEIPEWVVERLPHDPFTGVLLLLGGIAIVTVVGGIANFLHQYLS